MSDPGFRLAVEGGPGKRVLRLVSTRLTGFGGHPLGAVVCSEGQGGKGVGSTDWMFNSHVRHLAEIMGVECPELYEKART